MSYILIIINVVAYAAGVIEVYGALDIVSIKIAGLILVTIALSCMFISQLQMGKNWRIGVDQKNKTDIVEGGFFKYMRHPIYFFAVFIVLGIVLVIPWVVSLCLFYIFWVALSIQARLEEEFLIERHGQEYKNFMRRRKRWFS